MEFRGSARALPPPCPPRPFHGPVPQGAPTGPKAFDDNDWRQYTCTSHWRSCQRCQCRAAGHRVRAGGGEVEGRGGREQGGGGGGGGDKTKTVEGGRPGRH